MKLRFLQRSPSRRICRLRIRPSRKQQLHDRLLIAMRRGVKRRISPVIVLIPVLTICPSIQQNLNHRDVPLPSRAV